MGKPVKAPPDPILLIMNPGALNKALKGAEYIGVSQSGLELRTPLGDTYIVTGAGNKWDVELYDVRRLRPEELE